MRKEQKMRNIMGRNLMPSTKLLDEDICFIHDYLVVFLQTAHRMRDQVCPSIYGGISTTLPLKCR